MIIKRLQTDNCFVNIHIYSYREHRIIQNIRTLLYQEVRIKLIKNVISMNGVN